MFLHAMHCALVDMGRRPEMTSMTMSVRGRRMSDMCIPLIVEKATPKAYTYVTQKKNREILLSYLWRSAILNLVSERFLLDRKPLAFIV